MALLLMIDYGKLVKSLSKYLPEQRELTKGVFYTFLTQLNNYIKGKVVELIIMAVLSYFCFMFFGLKYNLVLSLVIGVSVIIPYVGIIIATVPLVIVAFFQFDLTSTFYWIIGVHLALQVFDGNVLVPWLFSKANNLTPFTIVVAVLVFGQFWGVLGVFLAIPLTTLIKAVGDAWIKNSTSVSASGINDLEIQLNQSKASSNKSDQQKPANNQQSQKKQAESKAQESQKTEIQKAEVLKQEKQKQEAQQQASQKQANQKQGNKQQGIKQQGIKQQASKQENQQSPTTSSANNSATNSNTNSTKGTYSLFSKLMKFVGVGRGETKESSSPDNAGSKADKSSTAKNSSEQNNSEQSNSAKSATVKTVDAKNTPAKGTETKNTTTKSAEAKSTEANSATTNAKGSAKQGATSNSVTNLATSSQAKANPEAYSDLTQTIEDQQALVERFDQLAKQKLKALNKQTNVHKQRKAELAKVNQEFQKRQDLFTKAKKAKGANNCKQEQSDFNKAQNLQLNKRKEAEEAKAQLHKLQEDYKVTLDFLKEARNHLNLLHKEQKSLKKQEVLAKAEASIKDDTASLTAKDNKEVAPEVTSEITSEAKSALGSELTTPKTTATAEAAKTAETASTATTAAMEVNTELATDAEIDLSKLSKAERDKLRRRAKRARNKANRKARKELEAAQAALKAEAEQNSLAEANQSQPNPKADIDENVEANSSEVNSIEVNNSEVNKVEVSKDEVSATEIPANEDSNLETSTREAYKQELADQKAAKLKDAIRFMLGGDGSSDYSVRIFDEDESTSQTSQGSKETQESQESQDTQDSQNTNETPEFQELSYFFDSPELSKAESSATEYSTAESDLEQELNVSNVDSSSTIDDFSKSEDSMSEDSMSEDSANSAAENEASSSATSAPIVAPEQTTWDLVDGYAKVKIVALMQIRNRSAELSPTLADQQQNFQLMSAYLNHVDEVIRQAQDQNLEQDKDQVTDQIIGQVENSVNEESATYPVQQSSGEDLLKVVTPKRVLELLSMLPLPKTTPDVEYVNRRIKHIELYILISMIAQSPVDQEQQGVKILEILNLIQQNAQELQTENQQLISELLADQSQAPNHQDLPVQNSEAQVQETKVKETPELTSESQVTTSIEDNVSAEDSASAEDSTSTDGTASAEENTSTEDTTTLVIDSQDTSPQKVDALPLDKSEPREADHPEHFSSAFDEEHELKSAYHSAKKIDPIHSYYAVNSEDSEQLLPLK